MKRVLHSLTIPLLLAVMMPPMMWGWLESVFSGAKSVVTDVKNLIRAAVDGITGYIDSGFDAAWSGIRTAIDWTVSKGEWAVKTVLDLADRVWHVEEWAHNGLVDLVNNLVNGAFDYASGIWNDLVSWASGGFDAVRSLVNDVYEWVNTNVLRPLIDKVDKTAGFILGRVDSVWNSYSNFVQDFASRVWDIANGAVSPYVDAWHFVTDDVLPLWRRVKDWLLFLADHPFDWFTALFEDTMRKANKTVLGWMMNAVSKEGSVVDDWIGKFLS